MTALQVPPIVNTEQRGADARLVLVVDDDPMMRAVLRLGLEHAGFDVIEAGDGVEALERIEQEDVALVLLDGQLPRLSGREVLQRIRTAGHPSETLPVLLITADDRVQDRLTGLRAGADDYVTKPFAIEEVIARVRSNLRAHDAWRDTLAAHARQRAALSKMFAGAGRHPSLEAAAGALCHAIADQAGVLGATLVRFTMDRRPVVLATSGIAQDPVGPEAVDRADVGPWLERDPPRCYAPLEPFEDGRVAGILRIDLDAALAPAVALAAAIDCAAALSGVLHPQLAARDRAEMEGAEVRALLDASAFRPMFQPIVDLRTDVVVGAEALTRFTDGSSPERRFDEASALGLGIELELATLSAAVDAAKSLVPAKAWLSLNVSPELMLSPARADVRAVLDLRDRDVVLELSERESVTDYDAVRAALRSTGEGVRWSIDDAGSGFASLRHILRLEPAFIKLDRSWVEGVDEDAAKQAMIAGLCHFARQTGAQLIAEGIETPTEREALTRVGVTLGQGFLLGRPAPPPPG